MCQYVLKIGSVRHAFSLSQTRRSIGGISSIVCIYSAMSPLRFIIRSYIEEPGLSARPDLEILKQYLTELTTFDMLKSLLCQLLWILFNFEAPVLKITCAR